MAIVIREFEATAAEPAAASGTAPASAPKPADATAVTALLARAAARRARLKAH